MKAIELSLDMGRSVPLYCDLYNPALPAWNYLFLGGNRPNRSKIISSILLGEKINTMYYKGLVNIFSAGPADGEFVRLMNFLGGQSLDITKASINLFDYLVSGAAYTNKHLKIIIQETKPMVEKDPSLQKHLDFLTATEFDGASLSDSQKSFVIKKYFLDTSQSLWEKTYANTEPVISFKEKLAYILSGLFDRKTKDALYYDILEELNDFYLYNKEQPSFANFLNFINERKYDLYKKFMELSPDKLDFLHVKSPLILNEQGNYFYLPNNLEQEGLSSIAVMILSDHLSKVWDRRKYLVLDGFGETPDSFSYDLKIDCLRTSRKTGYGILDSVSEYPKDATSISNIQGVFSFNIKTQSEVKRLLTDFPLKHEKMFSGNMENFLKYELGVKEYQKTNLTYRSEGLKELLNKNQSSQVQAQLLSSKFETVKSRFLDLVVEVDKKKIGIWSVKRDSLSENDLVYLDNELSTFKCSEAVIILDKEMDEYQLYNDFNFKKVKNKMSFITKEVLFMDLERLDKDEQDRLFAISPNHMVNAKLLYIDLYNAGLKSLEI